MAYEARATNSQRDLIFFGLFPMLIGRTIAEATRDLDAEETLSSSHQDLYDA